METPHNTVPFGSVITTGEHRESFHGHSQCQLFGFKQYCICQLADDYLLEAELALREYQELPRWRIVSRMRAQRRYASAMQVYMA